MKFSVIIPCHNGARYISKALQSVQDQTHPAHEIIVVDDASTDGSIEVVQNSGIPTRLFDVNCRCAGGARNEGIKQAIGDWVAFLDADDFWYPHHLEEAARVLSESSDPVYMCHLDAMSHDESEKYQFEPRWSLSNDTPQQGLTHDAFFRAFSENFYFSANGVLQKRQDVLNAGGYDASQRQRNDVDQFMRVLTDKTWTWNPRPGWCYRVDTPGNLSCNFAGREYYMLRCLLKNREAYAGETMNWMIPHFAKRAMSTALADGTTEDVQLANELAFEHLRRHHQWIFRIAMRFPGLYRMLLGVKRRMVA